MIVAELKFDLKDLIDPTIQDRNPDDLVHTIQITRGLVTITTATTIQETIVDLACTFRKWPQTCWENGLAIFVSNPDITPTIVLSILMNLFVMGLLAPDVEHSTLPNVRLK
jgi:hypothetical protein